MDEDREASVRLSDRLDSLRAQIVHAAEEDTRLSEVHPANRMSARNLAHYVALRQHDVRDLQGELAWRGLSSLGRRRRRCCPRWMPYAGQRAAWPGSSQRVLRGGGHRAVSADDFGRGRQGLDDHATALLGPARAGRGTRIMVTLPSEAATDARLVERIVGAGAEVVRVNCAHDGQDVWAAMIRNVREAARTLGLPVKVSMDLSGPKVRTGPISLGPQVLRVRPQRDDLGRSVTPAELWITAGEGPTHGSEPRTDSDAETVTVENSYWLGRRRAGEHLLLRDARGSRRTLVVTATRPGRILTTCADTAYLVPGTPLADDAGDVVTIGPLPARERRLVLRVIEAGPRGSKLGPAKGINLPDTELLLPALSEGDLAVEAGYARLAEVQEEITDAAISGRAECVMLNKGPLVDHAVVFLDDILTRMAEHQRKKSPLLRQLRSWVEPA